ncbi:YhcH/YjgK/YiaL family protein [Vibrio sp. SCSIO 43136]|uniref:YhcH/YjgK/YiaL family protein n=1 Tax=Vibrio sp. SCSIO 43136 TaxID=2819101 RepID=UPI0020759558|nr:YhcH/YjgK/YiaL family protein [Vibrio sp. SCSIO 43136]USD66486.1 YhcH/YjgK/YiaL family protein [Vibrio sp. SCSIO 43136]
MTIYQLDQFDKSSDLPEKIIDIINDVKQRLKNSARVGHYTIRHLNSFYFIVEEQTKPFEQTRAEIHHKFIDVQIVLEGQETYGFSPIAPCALEEVKLREKDVAYTSQVENERFYTLSPNEFMVFYPNQPHRPMLAKDTPNRVKKAVIKIDRALVEV